jgi:hypothetical protein
VWCIYIILSGGQCGPIKIGISKDPEQRVIDLQTGNPYTLVLFGFSQVGSFAAAKTLEASVHAVLAASRLVGEWFDTDPDTARRTILEKAADLDYEGCRPGLCRDLCRGRRQGRGRTGRLIPQLRRSPKRTWRSGWARTGYDHPSSGRPGSTPRIHRNRR